MMANFASSPVAQLGPSSASIAAKQTPSPTSAASKTNNNNTSGKIKLRLARLLIAVVCYLHSGASPTANSQLDLVGPSSGFDAANQTVGWHFGAFRGGGHFRQSATRVKLANLTALLLAPQPQPTSAKRHRQAPVVSFARFKSRAKMAPAYELWPSLRPEANLVQAWRPPVAVALGALAPSPRSALPKPMVRLELEHQDTGQIESDDTADDTADDPEAPPVGAESRKRARAAARPPVYPPGDLDRLYSDALLVYVKDFNQYIQR